MEKRGHVPATFTSNTLNFDDERNYCVRRYQFSFPFCFIALVLTSWLLLHILRLEQKRITRDRVISVHLRLPKLKIYLRFEHEHHTL